MFPLHNSEKGSSKAIIGFLLAIIALLIVFIIFIYSKSPNSQVVDIPTGTITFNNPVANPDIQNTQDVPDMPLPASEISTSRARRLLEMMNDQNDSISTIMPDSKEIFLSGAGGKVHKVMVDGWTISPSPSDTNSYYMGSFMQFDSLNSGDTTFKGSVAYKDIRMPDSLICIDEMKTIAPNNDYTKCDETSSSRCIATKKTFCADISESLAEIKAIPSITVLYPNGGETLREGETYLISWSASNYSGPFNIRLLDVNDKIVKIIASNFNDSGTGYYNWTIPMEFVTEASPAYYRITVSSPDGGVVDITDDFFMMTYSAIGK